MAGACGDALGYPVEFIFSFAEIAAKYGSSGIIDFDSSSVLSHDAAHDGGALISDDTQMTLYTAAALIESDRSGRAVGDLLRDAYVCWYSFQAGCKVDVDTRFRELQLVELNQRRAPGNTCLQSLSNVARGQQVVNSSKGCGGIMRVAPIGLWGASHGWSLEQTARVAGESAEITHCHPLSSYASAACGVIIQQCALAGDISAAAFKDIVSKAVDVVECVYGAESAYMSTFKAAVRGAVECAGSEEADYKVIESKLGSGWVAEETLAIAIFSVLRHIDDAAGCLVCAVNHGGDSDSTGAVAGNIIGAIVGADCIPARMADRVQFKSLILRYADALCQRR